MKRINISQIDTIFADGSFPIEFLLFYKDRIETSKISTALNELSTSFWPIFGEYSKGEILFDKYCEDDCFNEEVFDQEFDKALTNQRIYENYYQINSQNLKKLFFLKIIQYRNGTLLIPKMKHLAGDGYSYFYFLSALAELTRNISTSTQNHLSSTLYVPSHNRTILKDFQFSDNSVGILPADEDFLNEYVEIPRIEVRHIIADLASSQNQKVSGNDILSAIVVKQMVEKQKSCFGDDIQLSIPIDVRIQIKEYGQHYFGNALMFQRINFKVTNIQNSDVKEIAIEIRKSMPLITKETYIKYLDSIENIINKGQINKLEPFDSRNGCLVTNLSQMPINKLNFGTGDPDLVFPLSIKKNSVAVLANRDNFILRIAY
jgi:Transferase family